MRVSLGLPTHRVDLGDEFISAAAIAELATAAEAAGFDAVFVTDHPFPPTGWLKHGGHHALDPLVALSFAAAVTSRLRLQTNLFVPAYRNPYVSAKAIATLDALSGGRVILGVGAGYLEPEFDILGASFESRNDDLDAALLAMKAAWANEVAGHDLRPSPVQQPHPPIWIGGNSKRAIRRAVDLADGWVPMPSPAKAAGALKTPGIETLSDLAERLDYMRSYAAEVGKQPVRDIAFMPSGLDMFSGASVDAGAVVDGIAAMAEVGMTYATLALSADSRKELLSLIELFANDVLPKVEGV